jgi:hypothetical protein
MQALGQTVVMHHALDRHVLDGNHIELVDNATAVLLREIAPPPGNTFMDARHHRTPCGALRRPLLLVAETPVRLGKLVFLTPEAAGVGDLLLVAQGGEGRQPHVNAHWTPTGR